ncbi:acyl carrier protein [Actinocrispum wychmicini]|uniref:acyl carrier protein n=1 Tax=Actinocrispum wychmicini TaxID=1213861 RepID=UPI0010429795|nr:acyl carrier protein [Actinocrispum wychmicini]
MSIARQLRRESRTERRDTLEELIVAHMREVLQMGDDEELFVDRSYFDLGFTSLKLTDVREYLQKLLDVRIDATVLFNEPTVEHLVEHLADVLSDATHDREVTDAA